MSVRPARAEDVRPLAAALSRAFHDDPVTGWVYASERRRAHWSSRFFRWQLERLLPQDACWATEAGDGAALWALPDRWREEARESITLLRRTMPGVLPRLPRLVRGLGQVEARHPVERHLYLAVLGVDPVRQGQGLGSALIRPGLELADREGLPAYLETGRERNLAFYGRHGFSVVGELDLPKGPRVWFLWREPG
ncbi:GNAT family N-acetyltransferase [Baekduia soli]|uniref:GNAT family N-acetyltransferase n=1 Tax=Baekduia soli TaxID=496014 RepID=A0A5B8U2I3_9ACTN|nr:GNAT family N-acetyltransferase [Baekduia soli]QEC47183.1 GNAT family N-acetyltransferase [Baekduia soli]